MTALLDVLRGLEDEFDVILLVSHVAELRDALDETITVSAKRTAAAASTAPVNRCTSSQPVPAGAGGSSRVSCEWDSGDSVVGAVRAARRRLRRGASASVDAQRRLVVAGSYLLILAALAAFWWTVVELVIWVVS
jgi:hypothetical protein